MKTLYFIMLVLLSGCATKMSSSSPPLDKQQVIYIMPFSNQSTMPMAQAQAEQLLASVLADAGLKVELYPKQLISDIQASLEPEQRLAEARAWLATKQQGYVMTGSVQEWQYKYGLDGEPAIGVSLQLTTIAGEPLWRGSVARSGWGRESLSHLGLKTLNDLTGKLNWK